MTGPAEAMGIKIGKRVVKEDAYLWNLNPSPVWDLSRVIYRDNRITLSDGDDNLDPSFWQLIHAPGFGEGCEFARAA